MAIRRITKRMRDWLTVYAANACNKTKACAAMNITRQACYKWIHEVPGFREMVEEVDESMIDLAESKLMELIKENNLGAICFFLKCKGKGRGYIEKQYQTHEGNISLQINKKILGKDDKNSGDSSDS